MPDQRRQLQVGQTEQFGGRPTGSGMVTVRRQTPEQVPHVGETGPSLSGHRQHETLAIRIEQQHAPLGQVRSLGDQGIGAVRRLDQDLLVRIETPPQQAEHGPGQTAIVATAPLHRGQEHQDPRLLQGHASPRRVQAGRQQRRSAEGGMPDEVDARPWIAGGRQLSQGNRRVGPIGRAPAIVQERRGRQVRAAGPHEPGPPGAQVDIVEEQTRIAGVDPVL